MARLTKILSSFRRLSLFTQIWMMMFLGPAVFLPLFALDGPLGPWVAVLSILGFAPAIYYIWVESGFSKRLAIGHVIFWPVLLVVIGLHFSVSDFDATTAQTIYLINATVLAISMLFDVREVRLWLSGDRSIA